MRFEQTMAACIRNIAMRVMELVVVADRAKHRQSHTSTRLPAVVQTCCPMPLVAEVDCKCKLSQQRHGGIEIHSKAC